MKTALLVLNFGGPRSPEEIEPFLRELFSDRDTIRIPIGEVAQRFAAQWIARRRSRIVRHHYGSIGGASPLVPSTVEQVARLKENLAARGHDSVPVYMGMRYTGPSIDSAVDEALEDGAERLVCLALYPQYSISTTGSAFNAVARRLNHHRRLAMPVRWIPAFYRQQGYLKALASRITDACRAAPADPPCHVLFSAHGVPSRMIRKKKDPYMRQVQDTVARVMPRVQAELWRPVQHTLAWQSRVGPVHWIEPSTDDAITALGSTGVKNLVVVPISFVSDHLETLYEIDQLYGELAASCGIANFRRTEAMGTHPDFIDALASAVEPELTSSGHPSCERCLLPVPYPRHMKFKCKDCGYRFPTWRTGPYGGV